ncbi:hypothetical protein DDE84_05970 [Bifidobacterium tibiigranuli]|uniref:Uncharacterized protein n=1 Tax=Bifidobacterium tibiigranuli TaxID=2172043 RepID=A0A5N6S1Y4_9BIFI|nr:hypothetical protein DDE84_05970 [Bifidobacterium tibiigranuli]KAE8128555.1 hypothetical protein DDF78_05375 [Bifidobacterium tibiigranuli]
MLTDGIVLGAAIASWPLHCGTAFSSTVRSRMRSKDGNASRFYRSTLLERFNLSRSSESPLIRRKKCTAALLRQGRAEHDDRNMICT